MNTFELNVGMNVQGTKNTLNHVHVYKQLIETFIRETLYVRNFGLKQKHSNTEMTYVVKFETAACLDDVAKVVKEIANFTRQDAIAILQTNTMKGLLQYSDKPIENWGEFNLDYFLRY